MSDDNFYAGTFFRFYNPFENTIGYYTAVSTLSAIYGCYSVVVWYRNSAIVLSIMEEYFSVVQIVI